MATRLEGKLVLVTGATAGIGKATAIRLVAEGARVIAVARNRERLDALVAELPGVIPHVADISDRESMESLAATVLADVGVPDVVIANAGIGLDARFVQTDEDDLRRVYETNTFGTFRTLKAFLPAMIERGSGRLVVVSSVSGVRGLPAYTAYSSSKFALHGMLDCLHAELRGTGVTAGAICPSSTESEFHDRVKRSSDGQKKFRPFRATTDAVARRVVQMARSKRRDMLLSLEGWVLVVADVYVPWLVDRVLARLMLSRRG